MEERGASENVTTSPVSDEHNTMSYISYGRRGLAHELSNYSTAFDEHMNREPQPRANMCVSGHSSGDDAITYATALSAFRDC